MLHKSTDSIAAFVAGDETILKEVLHPSNDDIPLAYSIAQATIDVGKSSLPHTLVGSEVYYILEGEGEIIVGEEKNKIRKGDVIYVPPSEYQYVINTGTKELSFLCMVSPAWKAEEEKIFDKK